mmetsp:Transcript_5215/g.23098  ORF Transcript_5215/g.23098 Transcript_5215/m.23098 type:complete len:245 (+) Transcript_5215:1551-2285(+)
MKPSLVCLARSLSRRAVYSAALSLRNLRKAQCLAHAIHALCAALCSYARTAPGTLRFVHAACHHSRTTHRASARVFVPTSALTASSRAAEPRYFAWNHQARRVRAVENAAASREMDADACTSAAATPSSAAATALPVFSASLARSSSRSRRAVATRTSCASRIASSSSLIAARSDASVVCASIRADSANALASSASFLQASADATASARMDSASTATSRASRARLLCVSASSVSVASFPSMCSR